ncbi:MAG TPA: VWA domain-containing protein [Terracidiphilus sp.]|nr:VWA domain-containing protein [Terracidiphilus sp.]
MKSSLLFSFAATVLIAPGLCMAQASAAHGPASDEPVATLKVQAREVLLPVTVRDKHGALVSNLTAGDFTLTEDNRPQTIKSFSRESNLPFLLGLMVDTSRTMSGAMDSERKAAEKFVESMLPADPKDAKAGDQAFLLHFDREVELLEDFTNSRNKLDSELEAMGPTAAEHNNPEGPETSGDDGSYGRRNSMRNATQLYDAIYLASDELMKPKPGRKALIIFSDGVDRGSKETLSEALDAADHANLSIYTIYFRGETQRSGFSFPGGGRGGMGGSYPGGGGGWPGGGGGGHRRDDEMGVDGFKIMQQIATRTGGRYFEAKKKENLNDIYNQIAEELRGQYLLTYTPDQVDNDGGYHKIALKAKKDDLIVITREGYYAPGGDSR